MAVRDFEEWYRALRPRMRPALTAWCGDPSLAADAMDEAFVRALERWSRVSEMDSPEGWLWRTATNSIRRRERRRTLESQLLRRQRDASGATTIESTGSDVDLVRALQTLTVRQRTAVVLRYVADLPEKDVAEMMGIAPGTVSATLHRARELLTEHVTDPGEPEPRTAPRIDGALP